MTSLKMRFGLLLVTAALASGALFQQAVAAESMTDICLKNGILLRAPVDARDGKFFVRLPGKDAATDMTGKIHSVGVPDDPVCGVSASGEENTAEFGVRGSNTIGERLMPMLIEAYSTKTFGAPPIAKNVAAGTSGY